MQKRSFRTLWRVLKELSANNNGFDDIFNTDKNQWELKIALLKMKWTKDGIFRPL